MDKNKKVATIDLTPTWEETANMLIILLEDGNEQGKEEARKTLRQMGKICDAYVKLDETKILEKKNRMLDVLKKVYTDIELQNVKGGSDELNIMVQQAISEGESKI